ncbi:MAG: response regulator transcription factor, partial [Muribaculaceae bacterium]|nr:response regulator transcription factor [Muribaculaceae bacterium]
MRIKILVVDDEESICDILKFNLEKDGYEVDCACSAEEALEKDTASYSLFVLDIMMGRLSGFDLAKRLRNMSGTEHTPIIFCSALDELDDKVMGLNMGADDYITKPFNMPEVLARVRSVLRRSHVTQEIAMNVAKGHYEPDIVFHDLRVSRNDKMVYVAGEQLQLTRTEYDLLLFMLTHRNRIYSRDEILQNVWADDVSVTTRAVDTNLARLRKKIGVYGTNI